MMPYQIYQLFETERPKSTAEHRAADARRSEFAADISRPVRAARARMRVVVAARRPSGGLARPTLGTEAPDHT